jgi:hypothetical protein
MSPMQQMLLGTGPSIKDLDYLEENFKVHTYIGNNTTNQIETGIDMGGRGAMVLIKARDSGGPPWEVYDTDRGVNAPIITNGADTQRSENANQDMVSFNDNGFTLGSTGGSYANFPNYRTVSYTFKKRPKFFDIQTYTGNSVNNRQISHDLDAVAGCVWIKCLSHAEDWIVWHKDLSGTSNASKYLKLNEADASANESSLNLFNNAVQNSTTSFTLGDGEEVNGNGRTYVMYLFADDENVFNESSQSIIHCGTYTGNGSVDGPDIYLGPYQEPQFLLIKSADHSSPWIVADSRRGLCGTINPATGAEGQSNAMNLNQGQAEYGLNFVQPYGNGFFVEGANGSTNQSGNKFIYIAITAETGRTLKAPTSADELFDMRYRQTGASSRNAAFGRKGTSDEIKFPVDLALIKRVDNSDNWYVASSKMQNNPYGKYLSTSQNTSAVQNNNGLDMSFMNGFSNSNSWTTNTLAYMWKRSKGFDVQTYSGGGQYHKHNLGQAPTFMLVKDLHGTNPWRIAIFYPASMNAAGTAGGSRLYATMDTNGMTYDTNVFSHLGSFGDATNFLIWLDNSVAQSNHRYLCLLFAPVSGISATTWYIGDNTNTKTINVGFKPRFLIIKDVADGASNTSWGVFGDQNNAMWTGNDNPVALNNNDARITGQDFVHSFTSTGFSLKNTSYGSVHVNLTGRRYFVYAHA